MACGSAESHDAESILAAAPTTSVVVCSGGVSPTLINSVMREERLGGREPLFHPGSWGIDARRVKASPVANEAFLYVESGSLSRTDLGLKRIFDIVVSASLLLIAAPLCAVTAVLITCPTMVPSSSVSGGWVGTTGGSRC